uniref:Large ribosomal subunit protein uL3c n=1 Tax=Dunaliella tertiolecta TaxID=3047 RepID=A0A7S3VGR8_DUNTE|mmetsp:Transcript_4375/g.11890  ORF Transcript_4375/g.11890 Transcript_4375/m.11890 type:complete len:299 (+) Transcript_4375:55-951(+)|eukprot:CAMPEP_0202378030 /NCGR_PEP_ID=MMETSP1127-20130417/15305_1 /ASSEMBLY_ACC=CAM_ASM_000462 /TAXON_ID=3047 /ORGANISM="Dunaliella tertiolecta, Strain CCMP1320" /LENGTH=298 /DNA_ID=CAMNT_0048976225 /DNA_START=46 /DNA_END=942 /DNA_ORIENTATION=-
MASMSMMRGTALPMRSRATAPARMAAPASRKPLNVVARSQASAVGIFGTKAGMMSYFREDGTCVPATVIALEGGNMVTMIKTEETDGYNAVQVGYKTVPERKVKKPELGHLKKAGCPPMRHLREFKLPRKDFVEVYEPGQQLEIEDIFKVGDEVDVAGKTIGKGFQGTIKRWHHHRGLMTHGSKSHREHGSTGASTTPSRVFPGLKMAGKMGNARRVVKQQEILKIDLARKAIVIKGCVPGKPGSVVEVTPAKIVGKNSGLAPWQLAAIPPMKKKEKAPPAEEASAEGAPAEEAQPSA